MRKIINISLPEHLAEEIEATMKQRGYGTKSELFRDLLRAWKEGTIGMRAKKFDAHLLLKNAKRHAVKGGPRNLSLKHDQYLYGE